MLAETLLAGRDSSRWAGNRHQVVVHLEQSLLDPDGTMAAFLDDGTHVSAEAFRRLSCDGGVVSTGAGKQGHWTGRRTRVIAPALRRALWLRDRGCRFPACANRRFVHGHHIQHWADGGATTKENLVLLCSFHHRLLHEGGFTVARTIEGDLRFLDTRRRVIANVPPAVTVRSAPDRSMVLSLDRDLSDDPELNACGWDGASVDYDAVLDDLVGHAYSALQGEA